MRARFLFGLVFVLAGAFFLIQGVRHRVAPTPPRGVVVYLVDTLRADHLGCYGYERDTSPNLDLFAAEGVVFTNTLSQSTWTKPSSASVLTGLYPSQHGATNERLPISPDAVRLAQVLSEAGLRTGSFFANSWVNERHGFRPGFETFEFVTKEVEKRGERVIELALDWIGGLGQERFFAYLHQIDPHAPYMPPAPYDARFDDGYSGSVTGDYGVRPGSGQKLRDLSNADLLHLVDLYDGEIAWTDHLFGRFIAGLKELGRYEDTLIVFLADHGEEFRDHGGWRHPPQLYQEVVRVPLVWRFPDLPAELRGTRHEGLAQQVDIAPTILAALGLTAPMKLPGANLRSALGRSRVDHFGLSEVDRGGRHRKAVVGAGLKYIRVWAPEQKEILFDLASDPGETINLLPGAEDRASEHRAFLERYVVETSRGWFLLFQNGTDAYLEVECRLFTESAPLEIGTLYTEEMLGMGEHRDAPVQQGEIEWQGRPGYGARKVFHVAPGDGDGLRFVPVPEEASVELMVDVNGTAVDPAHIRLGTSTEGGVEMPLVLDLADAHTLDAPIFGAEADLGSEPYRLRLWHAPGTRNEEVEFTELGLEDLRALGYLGEN